MEILYFFESIRNPFLDFIMSAVTHLGEETVFMVIAIIMYWCVNKKEGLSILAIGFIGTVVNQFLKVTFRVARPWVKDPNFTIVESARAEATGYSFPSGHTQSSIGTFGAVAMWAKKNWLRIICIAACVLVPISRMYLGVHTPLDVGVSAILSVALILVLVPLFKKHGDDPKFMWILIGIMCAMCLANLIYLYNYPFEIPVEGAENHFHAVKNAYKMLGTVIGFAVAYFFEARYIRFETAAHPVTQVVKVVVGLAIVLAVKEGLKPLMTLIFDTHPVGSLIRYMALVIAAAALWPMAFAPIDKFIRKKLNKN